MRPGLQTGVNVDAIDVCAGLIEALDCGYTSVEHQMVAGYALARWARGEEDGALASFRSGGFSLIDAYRILAAARAEAERPRKHRAS